MDKPTFYDNQKGLDIKIIIQYKGYPINGYCYEVKNKDKVIDWGISYLEPQFAFDAAIKSLTK